MQEILGYHWVRMRGQEWEIAQHVRYDYGDSEPFTRWYLVGTDMHYLEEDMKMYEIGPKIDKPAN